MKTGGLIILDRDGVINFDSDAFIRAPDEWIPLPGSLEAIASLTQANHRIVVATNQSGIARGYFDMATLVAIHDRMLSAVSRLGGRIDAIFYCPHTDAANCRCRKPSPGMFEEISRRYQQPLAGVPCVGDSLRDLEAAVAAGGVPHLVCTGKGEKTRLRTLPEGTEIHADLAAFVAKWLA